MPVHGTYIQEENRLDLSFDGNLDVTVSHEICDICGRASSSLDACIIDLSDVERMFDSGLALLQMLYHRLIYLGTTVVILCERPEIRKRIPEIARRARFPQIRHDPVPRIWPRVVESQSYPL